MKYPSTTQWNQITKVNSLLEEAGLNIKARCQTHDKEIFIEADIPTITAFEGPQGNRLFKADFFITNEKLDKYFSPEVFVLGITQRKDYILASHEVKVECYKQNIHPAHYKAPTDEVDVMQDIPNPIPVKRVERKKTTKYPNGYQGKVDFYLMMAAKAMGTTRYTYYDGKVKYFLARQEEWLKTNETVNI
jgi:hypothetical protein